MENQLNNQDVEIGAYLRAIWQRLWLVFGLAVVTAGGMYFFLDSQIPLYEASSKLLVVGGASDAADAQLADIQVGERLALSYVERLSNREVLAETIQKLGLNTTVDALREELDISPVGRTQLIELAVRHTNPQTARDLANEIPSVFASRNAVQQTERFSGSRQRLEEELAEVTSEINDLTVTLSELESSPDAPGAEIAHTNDNMLRLSETYSRLLQSYEDLRIAEANQQSNIIVDEAAVTPLEPVWPSLLVNTILAGILGALAGVLIIVIGEFFDNSVKTPDDVRKEVDLPTLTGIAPYPMSRGEQYELITRIQPRSPISEAYRGMRTAITFANVDRPAKSLVITSANPSEGKSITTANLGVVMAQAGNRVLIIDADLRKPVQHKVFKINRNNLGLTHVLLQMQITGDKEEDERDLFALLEGVIHETEQPGLFFLNSGSLPPNPAELVGSTKMKKLVEALSASFDMVLVDSPPVLAVTDSVVMSTRVDDVVLVCKSGDTRLNNLQQAVSRLDDVNANVIGVVLNKLTAKKGGYYYAHYYSNPYQRTEQEAAADEVLAANYQK